VSFVLSKPMLAHTDSNYTSTERCHDNWQLAGLCGTFLFWCLAYLSVLVCLVVMTSVIAAATVLPTSLPIPNQTTART